MRGAEYAPENARSKRARMARPKDLLAWFMDWYYAETTSQVHRRGIWVDRKQRSDTDDYRPVGGSLLGSPAITEGFRRIVDDDPFEKVTPEYEGHKEIGNVYATPLRAALARVAGRGKPTEPGPFMALVLHRTFARDGDWDGACASLGIIEPVRRPYIEAALHRLYDRFHEEPPVYTVRGNVA